MFFSDTPDPEHIAARATMLMQAIRADDVAGIYAMLALLPGGIYPLPVLHEACNAGVCADTIHLLCGVGAKTEFTDPTHGYPQTPLMTLLHQQHRFTRCTVMLIEALLENKAKTDGVWDRVVMTSPDNEQNFERLIYNLHGEYGFNLGIPVDLGGNAKEPFLNYAIRQETTQRQTARNAGDLASQAADGWAEVVNALLGCNYHPTDPEAFAALQALRPPARAA